MQQLNKRILRVTELIQLEHARPGLDFDSMSDEEAEKIRQKILSGPPKPLYAWTPEGYVNIHQIKSQNFLEEIADKFAQKQCKLLTRDQLQEIGIEPYRDYSG